MDASFETSIQRTSEMTEDLLKLQWSRDYYYAARGVLLSYHDKQHSRISSPHYTVISVDCKLVKLSDKSPNTTWHRRILLQFLVCANSSLLIVVVAINAS